MAKGTARELVNVVVAGDMNPAIHQPRWYKEQGIITAEQADEAAGSEYLFVQPISQFRFSGMKVTCQPNRWEVSADQWSQFGDIAGIARKTWSLLSHTPIRGIGVNVDCDREVDPLFGSWMATVLGNAFALPAGGQFAQLASGWPWEQASINFATKTFAERPGVLTLAVNVHFPIEVGAPRSLALLDDARDEAVRIIEQIFGSLSQLRGAK